LVVRFLKVLKGSHLYGQLTGHGFSI